MDEQHPLNPRSPYAATKAGGDRLVYSYACTYDMPVFSPPGAPNNVYVGSAMQYSEIGGRSNGRAIQRSEDGGNVARVVLSVAVHANHIFVAQFVRQPIPRLHASPQAQMMRKSQHLRASSARQTSRGVHRTIIHYQNRRSRDGGLYFFDHSSHRGFFIERRNQDQNALCVHTHREATCRTVMECWRSEA